MSDIVEKAEKRGEDSARERIEEVFYSEYLYLMLGLIEKNHFWES